jgi:16S rRNA (adenine1518-N6/adenine1519-N6)-dimethyltransferase
MIFDKKSINFSGGSRHIDTGCAPRAGGAAGTTTPAYAKHRPSKALGQNFIHDTGYLNAIVARLNIAPDDTVVEIGVGLGTLTVCLAQCAGRVIAYEIDTRLEPILREKFGAYPNIELIFADALAAHVNACNYKIVANIPYYITSPIIMKFLNDARCTEICVLVQAEVADRITARVGGAEYGALSVTCQAVADCAVIKRVPRNMFRPVPNVDSAFVTIRKRACGAGGDSINGVFPDGFEAFIKNVFSRRRKMVSNSVPLAVLDKLGIDPHLRPENLTPEQFVKICNNLT